MGRDDEQVLRRRAYDADHDHPGPRPDRRYTGTGRQTAAVIA
ncbi:hypothetical protein OH738_39225 [Streptomyces hirsutus]|uniref:Uncharacterized protein n=1 Tax=Streptomyces hirsutus TaxID=35620 RepID=A0ABZ1GE72_9ACTN|nr:hypothetical protein [Streptomyces hirsutus]WSD04438.1 hypothetical protein OIE73_00735 [Streptomyces hirsutus]WTD22175.1 hypothetical protein OH738_39225 [Streptomyces hirsutus]WTD72753.1 hypothetical protein OHB56_01260 [Streptomyces sp. NBC_01635]